MSVWKVKQQKNSSGVGRMLVCIGMDGSHFCFNVTSNMQIYFKKIIHLYISKIVEDTCAKYIGEDLLACLELQVHLIIGTNQNLWKTYAEIWRSE